jgi:hypothetical protein
MAEVNESVLLHPERIKRIRSYFGPRRMKVTQDGCVHVRGMMPNTTKEGWYLFGNVADPDFADKADSLDELADFYKRAQDRIGSLDDFIKGCDNTSSD